jgi:signal transduction histidine kinase
MINGTEKERSRIARDLHDGIGGTLGSIRAQLGMLYKKHDAGDAHADFNYIMQLLADASTDLRKTAHNLMPEILLQEGLVAATELFCERAAKGHELNLSFSSIGEMTTIPAELELTLYRTIQELVQNILKHAEAKNALVQLMFTGTHISLTVEDDGKGIAGMQKQTGAGVGLKTITSRIQSLHGTMDVRSQPGEGTSIYIEMDISNSKV